MRELDYKGVHVAYDEASLKKYSVQKKLAKGAKDPGGLFEALEIIFAGHDEEYVEALGGGESVMGELIKAVLEDAAAADDVTKK